MHHHSMKNMRSLTPLVFLASCQISMGGSGVPDAVSGVSLSAPPDAATNTGPRLTFAQPNYDFGKVKSGESVNHRYIFTNTGTATLEITQVQPGCHCTTAGDWTHKVEPGKTGTVAISFDSTGFTGPVFKQISVTSNDKGQPLYNLQLKGTVWKPVEATPGYLFLKVVDEPGAFGSNSFRIVNNSDESVRVSQVQCSNKSVHTEIVTKSDGREYQVIVKAFAPLAPHDSGAELIVKTTSTNTPTLTVHLMLNQQPAVTVTPVQVTLPPPPLATRTTQFVGVRYGGTNQFSLIDPKVSVAGVSVDVKELDPGHAFNIALTFPEGFVLPENQLAELSVKTSHSRFALLKVPIRQLPKPAQPLSPTRPPQAAVTARPPAKAPTE
jgi:hypothetical protein